MKSGKLPIEKIEALAELNRIGWKYTPSGSNEFKIQCPCHSDKTPSASLNVDKNEWICHACGAKGDVVSLLAYILKQDRKIIILDLCNRYDLESVKTLDPSVVEKFHNCIWESGKFLQELYDRGITDDDIRKARIGYSEKDGRISIPVYDKSFNVINIRKYLPGAPGSEKMRNTPGYGGSHIYQIDQLEKYPTVWLCGGELKALVVNKFLNKNNVGAVAITIGEVNWKAQLTDLFKNKNVYICYDVDAAGIKGAKLVAGYLCYKATSVKIIRIPLDIAKYPKGDINDYIGKEKAGEKEILELMEKAESWELPSLQEQETKEEHKLVSLLNSTRSENIGKNIEVHALISAMDTQPYVIPKEIICECPLGNQKNCAFCPVIRCVPDKNDIRKLFIPSTSPSLLEMINSPKRTQHQSMMDALRIPPCRVVNLKPVSNYTILDVRLIPKLTISQDHSDNLVQPALIIGHGIEMNVPYILKGKPYPHPKNQQAVLLINEIEVDKDSLTTYNPKKSDLEELKIFKIDNEDLQSLENKLNNIYEDLEVNVTRIFHRRNLHVMIDLCYFSSLLLNFDGQTIKGWTNVIIIGDSSQGKSEATSKLMEHYQLGERVECKNATVAGLLGGLNQIGNRWFVSWGVIPTHDRRLVILEEVKGTSEEVLGKLTDMRSSGIAEIPKIEKRRTWARTRLIFVSNPRSHRSVNTYNFGIETIAELMGNPEDVRRFDAALIVSSNEINPEVINQLTSDRPKVDHVYTSDLSHQLILWTWTRKPEQIIFEKDANSLIFESSNYFCNKYSEVFPIVDRGTMRHKIARLAIAIAARVFSCDDKMHNLVVKSYHVQFVRNFLDKLYESKIFGYLDFSNAQSHSQIILDEEQIKKRIQGTKYPKDLVDHLLFAKEISLDDLCDWCELDQETARPLLSFFVRKHALRRSRREYYKSSGFIELLRKMKETMSANTEIDLDKEDF